MNSKELYEAVGGIDEKYVEDADAARGNRSARVVTSAPFASLALWLKRAMPIEPWLKRAMPIAACLVVAVGVYFAYNALNPPNQFKTNEPASSGYATGYNTIGKPSLKIDDLVNSEACYAAPDDWRGLPTEQFVLQEQSGNANRIVFHTLQDLADYADAFIVVPSVREVAPDGGDMQTAIAEYAEAIGDMILTRQWDDYTISTGSRILIRQRLIGGCIMDEPSNLLRVGGVYLLPVKFNPDFGAYEVVGDLDVLFELDDNGKIVSHSQFPEFNKYDGKAFSEVLDAVRAIYSAPETEFIEQPIDSLEQAEGQINAAYTNSGFRKFTAEFEKETVVEGADVYLFKVSFGDNGDNGSEYGAIAKNNGAFIRGDIDANGKFQVHGGLGGFPKKDLTKE